VLPNALARARTSDSSRSASKNCASFGFEPGQPPSIQSTPKASSRRAMSSLSWRDSEISAPWQPSRSVVS
jgi:hypothetical protein